MFSFGKSTFIIYIAQTCINGGNIFTVCKWINCFSSPWCLKKRLWKKSMGYKSTFVFKIQHIMISGYIILNSIFLSSSSQTVQIMWLDLKRHAKLHSSLGLRLKNYAVCIYQFNRFTSLYEFHSVQRTLFLDLYKLANVPQV